MMSAATEDSLIPLSSRTFLDALHLPSAVAGQGGASSGQITPAPDRRRRHQRSAQQTVRAEVGQPGGIGDIALAARHVLRVVGVDQHHRQHILKQIEERLPVVAGCFHHHAGDLLGE
jgi:hypothetical protein